MPHEEPDDHSGSGGMRRGRERAEELLKLNAASVPTVATKEAQAIIAELLSRQSVLEDLAAKGGKDARLLAAAVAHLGEGIMITDDDLDWPGPRIAFVNDAMCRITGYTAEELIGRTPRILQGEATEREALDRIKFELAENRPCLVDLTNYRKSGESYDAEVFITPLCDANERRTNFVSIHRDITKRKRSESDLRKSEERFRSVFENAPTGIAITSWEGQFEQCNPAYCQILGYTEEELREISFPTLVHPDDWPANSEAYHRLQAGEIDSFDIENRYVRKNGEWVWVHKFISILSDDSGKPSHMIALVTDVTERRRAEQELREREERLRAILNTAADAIITIDSRGQIASVNPATARMFGFSKDELIGRNVNMLMPAPYGNEHDKYIRHYHSTGEAKIIGSGREVQARRKDGTTFPVDLAVSEIDHLQMFTGIIRDITDRKAEQQRLLQAERLAAIGEAMAGLVHESRNALARCQANLRRLARRVEGQRELLDLIEAAQKAQEDIARQFEEVRAYAAPLSLNFAVEDVGSLLEEAWGQLSPEWEGRDAALRMTSPKTDLQCEVDRYSTIGALRNILENSLAASPDPVQIDVDFSETEINNRPGLKLTIRDHGDGMSAETAKRAADAFFTTKTRGTGLGLAIVKRIAEAHGGKFKIAPVSGNGTGSVATIILPKVR